MVYTDILTRLLYKSVSPITNTRIGTVKIEPPPLIRPKDTPTNAARIKPITSVVVLFVWLQRCV
jgi:hypothetical protein